MTEFGVKETFMLPCNRFINAHRAKMQRFLDDITVCTLFFSHCFVTIILPCQYLLLLLIHLFFPMNFPSKQRAKTNIKSKTKIIHSADMFFVCAIGNGRADHI